MVRDAERARKATERKRQLIARAAGGPTPRSPNGRPVHAEPDPPARKRGKMAGVGPTPCTVLGYGAA